MVALHPIERKQTLAVDVDHIRIGGNAPIVIHHHEPPVFFKNIVEITK